MMVAVMWKSTTWFLVVFCGLCDFARGQATQPAPVLADRPDARAPLGAQDRLGRIFESVAAGINFRAPADAKEERPPVAGGNDVVTFTNERQRWVIKVSKMYFAEPVAMTYHKRTKDGPDVNGLFEQTIDNLKRDTPGIEILRSDIVKTGQLDIGLIAGRYRIGTEENVAQIALVRQTPADAHVDAARLYYTFSLSAAAPRGRELENDPNVRAAVETFDQIIDSIKLLDQTAVREEQNQRLYRTRSLFVNLTETRLKQALVREQWLRLMKDGKDVGYSYVVEDVGRDLPRSAHKQARETGGSEGVLIGVRTRTVPEPGVRVDGESWMWTSFDRRHEKWSTVRVTDHPKNGKEVSGDAGSSDVNTRIVKDANLLPGEKVGPKDEDVDKSQPAVRPVDVMMLNVTHIGRGRSERPIYREPPPWYLTQALGHLLPRLVDRSGPKSYAFASYNGEEREVMMRYVDVEEETTVELGGRTVRAVPINDRWGLEGSVTTHYVDRTDVKYLGSVNKQLGIVILPTDAATLEKLWQDANLTPPGAVDERK
jgi:hypothetical protein